MSENKDNNSPISTKSIILVILFLIFMILSFIFGPTTFKAMSNYNSSLKDVTNIYRRDNKDQFFKYTPNNIDHQLITSADELPDKPVIVYLYIQNCPLCEVTLPVVENYDSQIIDKHNQESSNVVYVDMNTNYGAKLIEQYDIEKPTALLLLSDNDSEFLVYSGERDEKDGYIPTKDNIELIFKRLDNILLRDY